VTSISPILCVALQGADFNQQHWSAGQVQVFVMWLKPAQVAVELVLLTCSNLPPLCVGLPQVCVTQQKHAQVPLSHAPPTYLLQTTQPVMIAITVPFLAAVIRESVLELMLYAMEYVGMGYWQLGNNVILISPILCVAHQDADSNLHHWSVGQVQVNVTWLKPAQVAVELVLLTSSNLPPLCVGLPLVCVTLQKHAQAPQLIVPPTNL